MPTWWTRWPATTGSPRADALARQVLDPAFDVPALEQAIASLPALHGERRPEDACRHGAGARAARAAMRACAACGGAKAPSEAADYLGTDALPRGAAFMALLREAA